MATYLRWKEKMYELISTNQKIDITSGNISCTKWLIEQLSLAKIPFKVISLGAGVRRVTTCTDLCPKCNGTGRY